MSKVYYVGDGLIVGCIGDDMTGGWGVRIILALLYTYPYICKGGMQDMGWSLWGCVNKQD